MRKDIDEVSGDVFDVAYRIHRDLGPGLLEIVYEMVLAERLRVMGYEVEPQRAIDIEFEGLQFEGAFRIDLVVDRRLIVEIKSVERASAAHYK
jgi:GxxExxY protein